MTTLQAGFAFLATALAVSSWGARRFASAPAGPFYGPLLAWLLGVGVLLVLGSLIPA